MTRVLLFAGVLLLSAFSLQALPSEADLHNTIVLNEIVYNPRGPEVEGEWIELFNGGDSVNVLDWTITDQDNWIFQFPSLAVPEECYVVLHIGPGIPDSDFSDHVAHLYANKTTPRLNNDGDDLLLRDSHGVATDFYSYGSGNAVDYPPPELEWENPSEVVSEGYSSSVFPNGSQIDSFDSWIQSSPSPGETNGDLSSVPNEAKITEVYYDAHRDDEYVAITNLSPNELDIGGWILTDLEGWVAFPHDTKIASHRTLFITRNSTSFSEDSFLQADFQYDRGDAASMIVTDNIPQFNNKGDEIILKDEHGRIVDVFIYGYSSYDGEGWTGEPAETVPKGKIAKRGSSEESYLDTNASSDWESLREYGIGQSNFGSETINFEGYVKAFASPDTSFGVVARQIEDARERISINVYELTNTHIGDLLVSALERGVSVRILLEGSPVGGIKTPEAEILDSLSEHGADIRVLMDDEDKDIYSRYQFNHGKYALVDEDTVIVGSENWGDSGLPKNNRTGNRGWGILIQNQTVHDYFANIFESDWNPQSRDSAEYEEIGGETYPPDPDEPPTPSYEYKGDFASFSKFGNCVVKPVISPDTSLDESTIMQMMRMAEKEIMVEQFYIRPNWGNDKNKFNPYLEEVIQASRRGVQVYVLLDSSWYNTEYDDSYDNDDVVSYLNELRETEGLPLQAKLMNADSHGLSKLHNKGMIVDGKEVLISSINWNRNSIASNREIGIIVHDEEIASFYRDIFLYDWKDDVTPPVAHAGEDVSAVESEEIFFDGSNSFDDVGIVNFSWDLDGDGDYDEFGPQITHTFERTGNHTVTLRVEDAWGNAGTDTCLVSVLSRDEAGLNSGNDWGGIVLMIIVAVCITIPALFFFFGGRKAKDIKRERLT
jgi:phosphatidylserine/phosphatidylglycerophosphate/cardiolipin synthase-like enzyme